MKEPEAENAQRNGMYAAANMGNWALKNLLEKSIEVPEEMGISWISC